MPYLPEAVRSVLNQTYTNFELLIVEDGSTDDSLEYLKTVQDQRVRVEVNQINLGMAASLNRGMLLAQGKYIARLDADDISLPDRIQTQLDYFENHQEIEVCGSYAQVISSTGELLFVWKQVTSPLEIGWKILFKNPFIHSSVMFRKETVLRNSISYQNYSGTEDYQFWSEILKYGQGVNLNKVLVQYRRHDKNMTTYNSVPMCEAHVDIANRNHTFLMEAEIPRTDSEKLIKEYKMSQVSAESATLYFNMLKKYFVLNQNYSESDSFVKHHGNKLIRHISKKILKMLFAFRLLILVNAR